MTIILILLIVGLVYVALQQKKESTRNVILVVTGLLAFCMMGKEGLTVTPAVAASCTGTATTVAATCTGTSTDASQCDDAASTTEAACLAGGGADGGGIDGVWAALTCDLDVSTNSSADCPAGCASTSDVVPVCDLLAATDGSADCPAGCSSVAASAATTMYDNVNCSNNSWYNKYDASANECVGSLDDDDDDDDDE